MNPERPPPADPMQARVLEALDTTEPRDVEDLLLALELAGDVEEVASGEADQQQLPRVQDEVHALSDGFLEENAIGSGDSGRLSMGRGREAVTTRNGGRGWELQMGRIS